MLFGWFPIFFGRLALNYELDLLANISKKNQRKARCTGTEQYLVPTVKRKEILNTIVFGTNIIRGGVAPPKLNEYHAQYAFVRQINNTVVHVHIQDQ